MSPRSRRAPCSCRPALGINTFADALQAIAVGQAYVNIHTTAFPGGEIRGQLPSPIRILLSIQRSKTRVPASVRYDGPMARTDVVAVALVAALTAAVSAFEPALDPRSLADAIDLGLSRIDDARSRFHAAYHVEVMQPPVDYIEVVTPFRRIALDAEAHTRAGDRLYGQREALATLGDDPSRLDVVIELTFHPLNNYVGVPTFTVSLVPPGGKPIEPRAISRVPRFGPRLSGMPLPYPYVANSSPPQQGTQPLLGGSIVAAFDGTTLDPRGTYAVLIRDSGKDVAKATADLARLR